jgi:thiol-disulfide isomerase/thioredoxin
VPCKKFKPTFDKVSQNYKDKVEYIHYDAEKGPGKPLADKYKVSTLPTVMFMDAKGKVVSKFEGLMKEEELIKSTDALLK